MSVTVTSLAVEMALGGSYRKLVSDIFTAGGWDGAWYRFEQGGTSVYDFSGNATTGTTGGGVTLNESASGTPESGDYAFNFDGVNSKVTATFPETTTTFTLEYWVRPNTPSAGGCLFTNDASQLLYLASTGSLVPSMFYSGVDHLASSGLTDAVWNHLVVAVTAGSGTFYINGASAGTFSSALTIVTPTNIGFHGATNPLEADIDEFVYYVGYAMPAAEALAHYNAGIWTDVSADVLTSDGIQMSLGIDGNAPSDRIAGVGTAELFLRNDAGNSGGLQGYYSPSHANGRTGFTFGTLVRVSCVYAATTYTCWTGKIVQIAPVPGEQASNRVRVSLADLMNDFNESELRNITLQIDQTENALLLDIVQALPVTVQPLALNFDAGLDTIPFAFDDLTDGASSLRPTRDVVTSSLGFLYMDRAGVLHYENRQARQTSVSSYTFDNDIFDIRVPTSLDLAYNKIRVTAHPKRIDEAATTVLWSQTGAAPALDAGSVTDIWGSYFSPGDPTFKIGGTAQVTLTTDEYLGNTQADGLGTDKTSELTMATDPFASTIKFTVTNSTEGTVYLTKLSVLGKGLYDESPITLEAASVQPYGERAAVLDLRYQGSTIITQDFADNLLSLYETGTNQVEAITFDAQRSNAHMLAALSANVGDRITISETMTGTSMVDVFIHKISIQVRLGFLTVTFLTSPAVYANDFWVLEESGTSLGVNTVLGFG